MLELGVASSSMVFENWAVWKEEGGVVVEADEDEGVDVEDEVDRTART